ncbi:cell adhesion molecule CEACAM5-like [Pseudochaenichthys georgianus]|uniref:cell adhesion molecule CEACAM5-like n=1 Tax=Pseudochaenichthys georgianus TaxID=52239 RepID=UPI00146AD7E0|nr:carcinoembryonic antigen-related cell adhesion molecule 1 [Pseudochaenichthys georgianus]
MDVRVVLLILATTITASATNLVEFNDTAVLRCSVLNGTSLSYVWMKGSSEVAVGAGVQLSDGGATLTMVGVTRYDEGSYRCNVSNGLNNAISPPVHLNIYYGPSNTTMTITPMRSAYITGSNITLSCSAESNPPAGVQWMFNGVHLNHFGPELQLEMVAENNHISWYFNGSLQATTSELVIGPLTFNMSGQYTCMAHNNITGKNSSADTMLTILAPVTMASIKIVGAQPIMNHTFTLTYGPHKPTIMGPSFLGAGDNAPFSCYASSNPPSSYTWFFNGSLVSNTSEYVSPPLTKYMSGTYTCMAYNNITGKNSTAYKMLTVLAPVTMASIKIVGAQPIENHTFTLTYGPEMPAIMGPNAAKRGDNATFSCYASSNPPCSYEWFFNGSVVSNASEYVASLLTDESSVMYTCMAYNNITGKNSTAYKMLTVFDPIEDVQIETPMYPAIVGHFYDLTCNVTGTAEHFYWMKNGELLHEDNRTVFYMDNKIVTFNPLELNDTGLYECMALNPFWNKTSPSYMLLMNYGPETPMIDGPAFAEEGHSAVFTCSAKSVPPSHYSWWFNGSSVANSSVFTTDPLSFNMSGEYTCLAYNNVTENNSTTSKMLTVIEAISSVMIRSTTVPINSDDFTLTCDVSGPYDMIYWMKDNMHLNMTNSTANPLMSYRIKNNILYFTPTAL